MHQRKRVASTLCSHENVPLKNYYLLRLNVRKHVSIDAENDYFFPVNKI